MAFYLSQQLIRCLIFSVHIDQHVLQAEHNVEEDHIVQVHQHGDRKVGPRIRGLSESLLKRPG